MGLTQEMLMSAVRHRQNPMCPRRIVSTIDDDVLERASIGTDGGLSIWMGLQGVESMSTRVAVAPMSCSLWKIIGNSTYLSLMQVEVTALFYDAGLRSSQFM